MRRVFVLLVLAMTACSQGTGTPVAHVSASPAASPTPNALPFADLPLTRVGFSCRLPVYRQDATIVDSFISFPANTASVDPNGNQGMYFDRAFSRWLPVPRNAVAPDGADYVYIEVGPEQDVFYIHFVGVNATQTKNVVPVRESASAAGFGATPQIFDYAADGIYLTEAFEHVWPGVWFFQQPGGPISKLADVEVPELSAGSGIIWYGAVNPADPGPFSSRSSAGIFPDEVNRLDLKTGTRSQWLYRPGAGLEVLGVDLAGRPLIQAVTPGGGGIGSADFFNHSDSELLLGLDSTSQRSIYKGQLAETLSAPIADSHGVWFGSPQGIYLYTETDGLRKVSNTPGLPANGCF
jgi:hypothetical protein